MPETTETRVNAIIHTFQSLSSVIPVYQGVQEPTKISTAGC